MEIYSEENKYSARLFERCLSYLVINSDAVSNLGLFHGKMGLVLFFSIYSRYSQRSLYNQFAYELLDEIYEDIHKNMSLDFENGLTGIGWGIEYLVQNGYMSGDTDEILEDIDKRIMEYDLSRISDLSLDSGLVGIAHYVCARLSTNRRNNNLLPFDSIFLSTLKVALSNAKRLVVDLYVLSLIESFLDVLNGKKYEKLQFVTLFELPSLQNMSTLESIPLGLKNGLAGILLQMVFQNVKIPNFKLKHNKKRKQIVIFDEESRASNYGVGTYIENLTEVLRDNQYELIICCLRSYDTETVKIVNQLDVTQIIITNLKTTRYKFDLVKQNELYYRNVFLLLNEYLDDSNKYVFQLNYVGMKKLAVALKAKFLYSKIIMTVHYTSWCFSLLGNKNKLLKILEHPVSLEDEKVVKLFELEKSLLNICDLVIGVSKHSYDDLVNLYDVPISKLKLIYHGLKNKNTLLTVIEKKHLRKKYGFGEKDQILIFAGRLDFDKGIVLLADTFVELQKLYPRLRLLIVGDGDYRSILSRLSFCWSKVVFTGFVDQIVLYELYSISDIGVLPSYYEEFGYVALEMMMMGLPLVVNRTSGLSELVINRVTGIVETLRLDREKESSEVLQNAIRELLDDPLLRKKYAENGRMHYWQNYSFEKFSQQIRDCIEKN